MSTLPDQTAHAWPPTPPASPSRVAPPPLPPPVPAPVPASIPIEEEQDESVAPTVWLQVPAWFVSTIIHAILIILLSLFTVPFETEKEVQTLFLDEAEAAVESLEEVEILTAEAPEQLSMLDDPLLGLAAVDNPVSMAMASDQPALADVTTMAELTQLRKAFLLSAVLPTSTGAAGSSRVGPPAYAMFFGTKAVGDRFVYVLDNSNSMARGRLETALHELEKSVEQLTPKQSFYVLLFSDTAYPLFHPRPARGFVPATEDNKKKLHYWLETVEMCLHTRARTAMEQALSVRPDVIYILGDGRFTDDTLEFLLAQPKTSLKIHTLGMELNGRGSEALESIAEHFGGTYKDVGVDSELAEAARKSPRERNRTRGPIWGLALPNGGKKK